jgi:hypothetical protein
MNLGEAFRKAKEFGPPMCVRCLFYHSLKGHPGSQTAGTCNLNPPQVVSHDGKLHHLYPAVADDWFCGHFARIE